MSVREQPRDRQPFAGEQRPERPTLDKRIGGPLNAHIRVVPIPLRSGWAGPSGRVFELQVEWDGPGLPELPPLAPGDRAHVHEAYAVNEHELAQRAAQEVGDVLAGGRVPDVRAILRRLADRT